MVGKLGGKVNKITVIQGASGKGVIKDYDLQATFKEVTTAIFGTEIPQVHEGVTIKPSSDNSFSFHGYQMTGIKMEAGNYPNVVRRRIPVAKDNTIDADAVLAKFNELKEVAVQQGAEYQERQKVQEQARTLCERIKNAVNYPDMDWHSAYDYPARFEHSVYPDKVLMDVTVNGTQLAAIEKIIGEHKQRFTLDLNEADAIAVYKLIIG